MLIPDDVKLDLYCGIIDMRKSTNTLAILVHEVFGMELISGHLFLLCSRSGDKIKALYYQEYSFTLWYRRLEKETSFFHVIPKVILN